MSMEVDLTNRFSDLSMDKQIELYADLIKIEMPDEVGRGKLNVFLFNNPGVFSEIERLKKRASLAEARDFILSITPFAIDLQSVLTEARDFIWSITPFAIDLQSVQKEFKKRAMPTDMKEERMQILKNKLFNFESKLVFTKENTSMSSKNKTNTYKKIVNQWREAVTEAFVEARKFSKI